MATRWSTDRPMRCTTAKSGGPNRRANTPPGARSDTDRNDAVPVTERAARERSRTAAPAARGAPSAERSIRGHRPRRPRHHSPRGTAATLTTPLPPRTAEASTGSRPSRPRTATPTIVRTPASTSVDDTAGRLVEVAERAGVAPSTRQHEPGQDHHGPRVDAHLEAFGLELLEQPQVARGRAARGRRGSRARSIRPAPARGSALRAPGRSSRRRDLP